MRHTRTEAMEPMRVAVIGRTGRGDWGHALDELWLTVPGTQLVAVADETEEGLAAAVPRLKLDRARLGATYQDWRRMLAEQKPDIVSICMRHIDCHAEMAIAAAEAGVKGIFLEKPFVRSLAEADAVIDACRKADAKLALAFVNRHSPAYAAARDLVEAGRIGRLLELRGRGKEDVRGGGEDLWVLGCHILDMMADLGGAPQWCQALVTQAGRPITKEDAVEGPEGIGLIAGDSVRLCGWSARIFFQRARCGPQAAQFWSHAGRHKRGDPHPARQRAARLPPGGTALADRQGLPLEADRARRGGR